MTEIFTFALLGLLLGALLTFIIGSYFLRQQKNDWTAQHVARTLHEDLQQRHTVVQSEMTEKATIAQQLHREVAQLEQQNLFLEEKIAHQKQEILTTQQRLQADFENLANRLLEEKSQRFAAQNQQQMSELLVPLREHLTAFEQSIERKYIDETRERSTLRSEIAQLQQLNTQLSSDAINLTAALRGDSKTQGDWGELQLETLLENCGLTKGVDFETQKTLFTEQGNAQRPDCIVHLPEKRHIIVDSKVSLTAYERFCTAAAQGEQGQTVRDLALRQHVESLRQHVKELGAKNYTQLYQINTPDYVLLFVPIESALHLAQQQYPTLFNEALSRNVVLVSTSTLLATMRTVSYIWKQQRQKQNVLEIARQSGALYDKFVAFIEDLKAIGAKLDQAQTAYQDALNKLSDSKKAGDSLLARAERIRRLGAKNTKSLPTEFQNPALPESDPIEPL
jgi:DNA recombination protein RmuC